MSSNSPDLFRFDAFGTVALVAATDPARLDAAVAAVSRVVEEFDRACSRFRPDSELSLVNAAAGSSVPVGPVLLEAVTAALRAARLTAGDVDPTVGEALIALGYDRDFEELSAPAAVARSVPLASVPGWRTVSVNAASCLDANIASTAAIIRGERALAWLSSLDLPSRLVGVDGTVSYVADWPPSGDDLPLRAASIGRASV